MTNIATNKTLQVIAVVTLCVLAAAFLNQTYGRATRDIGYDFTSYLMSARALAHGENPYTTGSVFQYVYPLFLAFALIPLAALPYAIAVFVWYLIALGSLVWSARTVVQLAGAESGIRWDKRLLVPLTGIALLLLPVVQSNLLNGQVNFLVLLFAVLFLRFDLDNRRLPAAVCLAVTIAIKLFPAVLLLFLLLRRRYRTCFFAVVLAVAFCLLPALLMGWEGLGIVRWYAQTVLSDLRADVTMTEAGRQFFSLAGVISRLIPSLAGAVWLEMVSAIVIASTLVATQLKLCPWSSNARTTILFCAYLLATPLLSTLSETHHLALLIPAAIVMTLFLHPSGGSRRSRIVLTAIFYILLWLSQIFHSGFFVFAAIALALAIVIGMAAATRPRPV